MGNSSKKIYAYTCQAKKLKVEAKICRDNHYIECRYINKLQGILVQAILTCKSKFTYI